MTRNEMDQLYLLSLFVKLPLGRYQAAVAEVATTTRLLVNESDLAKAQARERERKRGLRVVRCDW